MHYFKGFPNVSHSPSFFFLYCSDWKCLTGLATNPMFVAVMIFTVGCQYIIVQYGGIFTKTEALSEEEWLATVVIGVLALPLGLLMRVISPQKERKEAFSGYTDLQESALSDRCSSSSSKDSTASSMENSYSFFSSVYHCLFLGLFPLLAAVAVICLRAVTVPGSHFAPLAHYVEFTVKYFSLFPRLAGIGIGGGIPGEEL